MRSSLVRLHARPALQQSSTRIRGSTSGVPVRHSSSGGGDGKGGKDESVGQTQQEVDKNLKAQWTNKTPPIRSVNVNPTRARGRNVIRFVEEKKERDESGPTLNNSKSARLSRERWAASENLPLINASARDGFNVKKSGNDGQPTEIGDDPLQWLELLQLKNTTQGHAGVAEVFKTIRKSGHDLPTIGQIANDIWVTLLWVRGMQQEIFEYALDLRHRTGRQSPLIYERIVGSWLSRNSEAQTLSWHRRIWMSDLRVPHDALEALVPIASKSRQSLITFRQIYQDLRSASGPFYDEIVPVLVKKGWLQEAMLWDDILDKNGDYPSSKLASQSFMREFQKGKIEWLEKRDQGKPAKYLAELSRQIEASESPKDKHLSLLADIKQGKSLPQADRGFFSTLISEMQSQQQPSNEPKTLSDEFCARLFATKALTITWIIAFLQAFSVKKLGPLALRELAIRSTSTGELTEDIAELQIAGISIGYSKFARLVSRFAMDGEEDLLKDLVNSDQHPENLEDERLQQNLLHHFLATGQQEAAHRQLVMLSIFQQNPNQEYMNLLLRHHVYHKNVPEIVLLADDMHAKGVKITAHTLALAGKRLLKPREPGHAPNIYVSGYPPNDLRIVTNLMFRAMRSGTEIPESLWVELFKRHGMENSFSRLAQFCHTTVDEYRTLSAGLQWVSMPRSQGDEVNSRDSVSTSKSISIATALDHTAETVEGAGNQPWVPSGMIVNPLPQLFTEKRLQYIIAWGFNAGFQRLQRIRDAHEAARGRTGRPVRYRPWPFNLRPPPPEETYLMGLVLVQQLFDKGVWSLHTSSIRKILSERLWTLYGPGRSRREKNVLSKTLNPYGILEFVDAVDRAWKGQRIFATARRYLPSPEEHLHDKMPEQMAELAMSTSPATEPEASAADFAEEQLQQYMNAILRVVGRYRGHSISKIMGLPNPTAKERSMLTYRWARSLAVKAIKNTTQDYLFDSTHWRPKRAIPVQYRYPSKKRVRAKIQGARWRLERLNKNDLVAKRNMTLKSQRNVMSSLQTGVDDQTGQRGQEVSL